MDRAKTAVHEIWDAGTRMATGRSGRYGKFSEEPQTSTSGSTTDEPPRLRPEADRAFEESWRQNEGIYRSLPRD